MHRTLKTLKLTKDFTSSGVDPILIIEFLSCLVEEAKIVNMSEGQLMVCLPHMLTKNAAREYRSHQVYRGPVDTIIGPRLFSIS